jgi:uncharacterized membrane protein
MSMESGYRSASADDVPSLPRRIRYEIIGESFGLMQKEMGTWVLASLILIAVSWGSSIVIQLALGVMGLHSGFGRSEHASTLMAIISFVFQEICSTAVSAFLVGGMFQMAIKQLRGERIAIGDLFSSGGVLGALVGGALLTDLAEYAGLALLILPCFVVSGLLMLTQPLIVDRKLGCIEAMSASWNALKSDWLNAAFFMILASICAGIGVIGCGIGLLFTMPVFFLSVAGVMKDFIPAGSYLGPKVSASLPASPPSSLDV